MGTDRKQQHRKNNSRMLSYSTIALRGEGYVYLSCLVEVTVSVGPGLRERREADKDGKPQDRLIRGTPVGLVHVGVELDL
jgi:hypothetical protein